MNIINEISKLPRMYYLAADQLNNNVIGIYDMMKEISKPDFEMVEIGSFAGISSILFAEMCKKVYCIDLWHEYTELPSEKLKIAEELFDGWLPLYPNINKIKMNSIDAIKLFENESLDLVYIDGGHDYESCKNDIMAWLPKIKKGGWITGHDIHMDTVRRAVEDMLGKEYKTYVDESWAVQIK